MPSPSIHSQSTTVLTKPYRPFTPPSCPTTPTPTRHMRLTAHRYPSPPIHSLPVELLARIFLLGAAYDYPYADSPFLLKPDQDYYAIPSSNFQLLVSHICQHWRKIALTTSSLWTTLHFRKPAHLPRAEAYIARCASSPHLFDILVDTVSVAEHQPGFTLCREEFHSVFDIIIPHVNRWRAFHLKVRDNECKAAARLRLSTCGPAPNLETLQLYHFEDYRTSQNLYLATYRPPVKVFSNGLPNLRNISLIGVNLPWADTTFLRDLRCIQLALHPDNIRPQYKQWHDILQTSPAVERLFLHYSGPRVSDDGDNATAWHSVKERIYLPCLYELSLTDLDPDYLCLVMERLTLPGVKTMSLDLPDQDFTPFVELVAGGKEVVEPVSPSAASVASTLSPVSPTSATSSTVTCLPVSFRPLPVLEKLEKLTVTALECSTQSWRALLEGMDGLAVLEVDFGRVGEGFFGVLMEGKEVVVQDDEEDREAMDGILLKGKEREGMSCKLLSLQTTPIPKQTQRTPLLPNLHTFKMLGLSGEKMKDFIRYREEGCVQDVERRGEKASFGLKRWIVRWSEYWKGRDVVLDELVERGWVGGKGRVVRVEWVEEEEGEDDDDDEDEVEEGEEDGIGDGGDDDDVDTSDDSDAQ